MAETKESLWGDANVDRSKLLLQHGFIKKDAKNKYNFNKEKGIYEPLSGEKYDSSDANEEEKEIIRREYGKTGYPAPAKGYVLSWEVHDLSLEEPYFWVLDVLKDAFPNIDKLEDAFAAAENSAFFGITQQRLGAQQDKVSQYLATMGKMIKELFQMVRELRILDERLAYYDAVEKETSKDVSKRSKSDDITLKGIFVDLVQGGGKSAASVFGMARELEFITLPDLFFDAPPFKNKEELEAHLKVLEKDFNRSVLRVLERHLRQYIEWRQRTHHEHKSRRAFMLKYLSQHFSIIRMYLEWMKPYLRHVSRLGMKESRLKSADLVSAFEGSMLDIEFLAYKKSGNAYSCVLATFNYRTRPELKVVQEGYQRGPVHIGKVIINLRVYGWSKEEIDNYKKLKDKETMMLMSEVSSSVFDAMTSLGEDLDKYIKEARGEKEEEEKKKEIALPKEKTFMEKFFGDFYTPNPVKAKMNERKAASKKKDEVSDEDIKKAISEAQSPAWGTYNNFKKAHGMIAW